MCGTTRFPCGSTMTRALLLAVSTVALMIGCRQHPPRAASQARPKTRADRGLVAHLAVDTTDGRVRFALAVANESDRRVELDFASGHTHDFIVQTPDGRPLWRWSAGRLFTQGMRNRLVEARDSVVFTQAWAAAAPGEYVVVAELRSDNHPVRTTTRFALR